MSTVYSKMEQGNKFLSVVQHSTSDTVLNSPQNLA